MFAGATDDGLIRRGVIAFNIAGSIPAGSTINNASLRMNMSRTSSTTAQTVGLYKLLADWGEGTSDATNQEGRGAPATTNDATWRHRFFSASFWATQGGSFSTPPSATSAVGAVGLYTWSSQQLTGDVQSWFNSPASNFGWVIVGAEAGSGTAKRFDTRESTSPPVLAIDYTPPAGALQPVSVSSRKVHGLAGTFDIDLPMTGPIGIENRLPTNGEYTLVYTFSAPLSSVDSATINAGTGIVAGRSMGPNQNQCTVQLTGVSDLQHLEVRLDGARGVAGGVVSNVVARMDVVIGDTNVSRSVNGSDISQVKATAGTQVNATNFRTDITANGEVNTSDVSAVKSKSGGGL